MADFHPEHGAATLIDFASGAPSTRLSYEARAPFGGITLARCTFLPNPGIPMGSAQVLVGVHAAAPIEVEWDDPTSDRCQRTLVRPNDLQLAPAGLPVFRRWTANTRALIIALDRQFVAETYVQAFDREAEDPQIMVGVADPEVQRFTALCDREIAEGGAAGRLYTEGLATALMVHLFRRYGARPRRLKPAAGGLAPYQLRRVLSYIDAHLVDDVSLAALAALTGLSTHHFSAAFKVSVGLPPHRYVVERKVHRVRELLHDGALSLGEIALRAGFAHHSHMTLNFRRLLGITPARYRESLSRPTPQPRPR